MLIPYDIVCLFNMRSFKDLDEICVMIYHSQCYGQSQLYKFHYSILERRQETVQGSTKELAAFRSAIAHHEYIYLNTSYILILNCQYRQF